MCGNTTLRRNVLKMSIAGATGAVGLSSVSSASQPTRFRGISYDTLTHQTSSTIDANIAKNNGSLEGYLNLAGYKIDLNGITLESSGGRQRVIEQFDEKRYRNHNEPLKLDLKYDPWLDQYHGSVTRQSAKFGKLGFTLVNRDDYDPKEHLRNHERDQKWEQYPASFSIPDKGIPTDSSLKRLSKLSEQNANRGDR